MTNNNQASNAGILGTTGGSALFFYAFSGSAITVTGPTADGTNGTPRTAAETRPRNNTLSAFIRVL